LVAWNVDPDAAQDCTLAVVQANRQTNFTIPNSWTSVPFQGFSIESNTDVLDLDDDLTRIHIKEDAFYEIHYDTTIKNVGKARVDARVQKNTLGSEIVDNIPDSTRSYDEPQHEQECGKSFVAWLVAGDYITLQAKRTPPSGGGGNDEQVVPKNEFAVPFSFTVIRLECNSGGNGNGGGLDPEKTLCMDANLADRNCCLNCEDTPETTAP